VLVGSIEERSDSGLRRVCSQRPNNGIDTIAYAAWFHTDGEDEHLIRDVDGTLQQTTLRQHESQSGVAVHLATLMSGIGGRPSPPNGATAHGNCEPRPFSPAAEPRTDSVGRVAADQHRTRTRR
jgi:hypothetical protein